MHSIISQKDNLLQQWRNTASFSGASTQMMTSLCSKIKDINSGRREGDEGLTHKMLREATCLNEADYEEFARWLLLQESNIPQKSLTKKLAELKRRRMLQWHIRDAPDDVIPPDQSMFSFYHESW